MPIVPLANPLKAKLRRGEAVLGAFCNIPSPSLVEILGWTGYDFVILDAEHGPASPETIEHLVRAAEVSGVTPVTRVAVNLQQNLLRYLDAGAMAVQVPMVNSAAEARAVVEAVRYPPIGKRGLAGVRAATYGIAQTLGEYSRQANQELLVVVQIETVAALKRLDDILAVDGIDVVFFGPTDLSSSLGVPGETTHPKVVKAIEDAGQRVIQSGRVAGVLVSSPDAYAEWRRKGFQYIAASMTSMIARAAKGFLQSCRESEAAL
jgi:4-hydroxy-2-oxoheptanedioate aldolase